MNATEQLAQNLELHIEELKVLDHKVNVAIQELEFFLRRLQEFENERENEQNGRAPQ